ncbi:MAG: enoyl-CoA hydratase/isomerase family protein [Deltaproteobacteria bacterium]|nr:enoyl-CoA hydratase/isomerase family protein [Deltaproteobacteria bacterium]
MDFTAIRYEKVESIATITLNRPDNMNTYNIEMLNELDSVLETVALDEEIRAVIITGEGRAFSAGADVAGVEQLLGLQQELPENQDILKMIVRVVIAIRKVPKPVIAALNGVCAGGAANFVLACDFVVASEKARMAQNFINIGLVPDGGGTFFLPSQIGYQRTAEILFTGKILTAQEAFNLGLYNKVVPAEEVMSAARELADELAHKPTAAIAAGKAILNRETIPRLRLYLEDEVSNQRCMVATHDAKEGITSFLEKRKPNFVGK